MNRTIYTPPNNEIKYGYFILQGGDTFVLWGHGSTPPYSDYSQLEHVIKPEFESTVSMFRGFDATILMPVLPRNRNSKEYPDMKMDAQIMTQETMGLVDDVVPPTFFTRPDIEITKIVDKEFGENTKFIAGGVSAGANMANRFSILHPKNVKGLALMLAGDFIYPSMNLEEIDLKYPFGLEDIFRLKNIEVNLSTYRNIPQFVFVGEKDNNLENDPLPFELNNDKRKIAEMRDLLGKTLLERTKHYASFLKTNGYSVTLSICKEIGHRINNHAFEDLRNWLSKL